MTSEIQPASYQIKSWETYFMIMLTAFIIFIITNYIQQKTELKTIAESNIAIILEMVFILFISIAIAFVFDMVHRKLGAKK